MLRFGTQDDVAASPLDSSRALPSRPVSSGSRSAITSVPLDRAST